MRSVPALANPSVLVWARTSAGFDLPAAAERLGQDERRVRAWEVGEEKPTIAQLRKASTVYKRPLAVFYLAEPPRGFATLRDFRHLPKNAPRSYSPELRYLIRRVLERQEWAAERRREHGARPLKYVGAETVRGNIEGVAQRIRQLLRVSLKTQYSWRNIDLALRCWIEAFESIGILVFQSSAVSVEEMRGFAVPDKYAPAVLVNSKDSRSARIFTLFHEFAHILLEASGVSNLRLVEKPRSENQRIEVFCNKLASESLLPRGTFTVNLRKVWSQEPDIAISTLAKQYSVSREVIARRLLDLSRCSKAEYEQRRIEYAADAERAQVRQHQKGEYRIPYSTIVLRDNGRRFSQDAIAAYSDGEITARDLSALLDVRLKHIPRIEQDLFSSRWQRAATE